VVDYMLREYKLGRTPNPDVMCNKEIKFGSFYTKALEMGADFIATGHYAQSINEKLLESTDKNKDQSYFLWTLTEKQLQHILFPVGHLQKDEVRKLAKKFKLPVADKKDSQGICFIGKVDMREFLSHYIEEKPGNVLNEEGKVIGTHEGAVFYTNGQRHGFTISEKTATDTPYYVINKNIENNTVTVSHKHAGHENTEHEALQAIKEVGLSNTNWINSMPEKGKKYGARIRYRQQKQECEVIHGSVVFSVPQDGVSAGQSVVLYDEEMCLGGGIIESLL
jgi:tRNA-specific 2-thiouridylase